MIYTLHKFFYQLYCIVYATLYCTPDSKDRICCNLRLGSWVIHILVPRLPGIVYVVLAIVEPGTEQYVGLT